MDEQFLPENNGGCLGVFEALQLLPDIRDGAKVSGWSWIKEVSKPSQLVVFADLENTIIGLAVPCDIRKDLASQFPISPYKTGWQGYVKKVPGPIKAYAVHDDKRRICELPKKTTDLSVPGNYN